MASTNLTIAKIKQNLQIDLKLKELLENYLSNEIKYKYEYDYMISVIKQNQHDKTFVENLLDQLRKCVDILEPKLFETKLVNLIFFEIKWHVYYSTNPIILGKLSDFLIELNSAYTSYIPKCLTFLIKIFAIGSTTSIQTESLGANENVECIDFVSLHSFSHNIITHLIKVAPACKTILVNLLDTLYPYMIKDTSIQDSYIKNLLKIASTYKDLRLFLLEICIQKMLKIDVNLIKEQILETESQNECSEFNEENNTMKPPTFSMKHPLADRLDIMMLNLFKFLDGICNQNQQSDSDNLQATKNTKVDWDSCKYIYKDLLFIFDKYIISTYGSSHVQFFMFYVCSFRSLLSEGFLDYLWKKFCSLSSCAVTRQICAFYIGSFLARAKFIPTATCVATLQLIVKWLHNYIENANINKTSADSLDLHRTFYSLCQTLFYIIIFRSKQLFQEPDLLELVKSWKLNEIISSKLNPLRYCLKSIRKKFAYLAYINQISYCYSIIDANNRISIPTSDQTNKKIQMFFSNQIDSFSKINDNNFLHDNPLDSFFPFDPYILLRSKIYVENKYQQFIINMNESESDTEDESDDETYDEESDADENMNHDNYEVNNFNLIHSNLNVNDNVLNRKRTTYCLSDSNDE